MLFSVFWLIGRVVSLTLCKKAIKSIDQNLCLILLLFFSQGNKGGVSIHLSFYGHMICFLNCHLAAHMNYASERVDEFERIMDTQTFECKKAPTVADHRWVDAQKAESGSSKNKTHLQWSLLLHHIQASLLVWRSKLSNSGPWDALCPQLHRQSNVQAAVEQRPGLTFKESLSYLNDS